MHRKEFNKIYLIRMGSAVLKESGGHPRHFTPPFALKYIQSLLIEEGYQVKLNDCLVRTSPLERLLSDVLDWSPSLIVIHCSVHSKEAAFEFASLVKKHSNIFIVVIGQGPTVNYLDYIFPGSPFDVGLLGEAEQEVALLLKNLNGEKNKEEVREFYYNMALKNEMNLISDLNTLPIPKYNSTEIQDYQFFYPIRLYKKLKWGHILTTRGCCYRCFFCSQVTRETYGDEVRLRNPAKVVDEIEYLISIGVNIISFDDDNFTTSKEHIEGICYEILKRNLDIQWIAHARIDELSVPLMDLMKRGGCVLLRFGIESGSKRIVDIFKKNPRNLDWVNTSQRVFNYSRRIGIATHALFMVGNPTETEDEIRDTIRLAKLLEPDFIQVHFFTIYPGSIAYEQFKDKIDKENLSKMYHYYMPELNLSNVDSHQLFRIRANFYREFFLRATFFIKHFLNYGLFYLHNLDVGYKLSKLYKILLYR